MSRGVAIEEELERLRALVEEQQDRLQRLEGESPSSLAGASDPRSRRDLLRMAGLGLAGAAGASLLTALPAAAANGGALILGQGNQASADTNLVLTSSSTSIHYAFQADATNGGTISSGNTRGLEAVALGASEGIVAASNTGPGAVLGSASAPDLVLGGALPTGAKTPVGSGRLAQVLRGDTGAVKPPFPATGGFGEIVRGASGELWVSTASGWRRQNTLRVDKADGTGGAFVPVRIIDNRDGTGLTGSGLSTGQKLQAGVTYTFGPFTGTNGIPADAIGVVGNVTVAGYSGGGYITVFPGGVAWPGNSTLNFGAGFANTGWANAFTMGFGTGANAGKISLRLSANGITSDAIVDVNAYFQ
jgi:hypothetical protein